MNIEGIPEAEKLRDYLYAKMRGARDVEEHPDDQVLSLLREIRDLLQRKKQT